MKKLFPARLTQRFFFLGAVMVLIPLLVIISVAIHSSENIIQQQTEQQSIQVAKTISNKTTNLFQYKTDLLESIVMNLGSDINQQAKEVITEVAVNDPFFEQIEIVDKAGRVIHQAPSQIEHIALSSGVQKLFHELSWRRASFVSNSISGENGQPSLYILVPIQAEEYGEIKGGLIGQVSLTYLQKYYKQNAIEKTGRVVVLDQEGKVLFDTKEISNIGLSLSSYSFFQEAAIERTGIFRGKVFGEHSLVAYSPIDHHPFISMTAIPLEKANAAIATLKDVLVKGFLIIVITAFILLLFSIRWVIKPIKDLTNEATRYAQGGEWLLQILREKDEIKTLSKVMKFMAESLKEKERYLQLILESFPFGVVTMNPDGTITSINKQGKSLLNCSDKNLIGKPISLLPIPLKGHLEKCKDASHDFKGLEDDFSFPNRYGKRTTMKRSSTPLLDEKDNVIGVLTTFWDVTNVRLLEKHIQRSEQLAAIGQMTAGLAHEVKNPLGTVQMASDLIDSEFKDLADKYHFQDPSSEIIKEAINDIQDEMQRLNELVKRFLLYSRENKKEETVFDLKQLVEETLQLLSHQFRTKQIQVTSNLPDENCPVIGDRNQIIQALINIFINSIEAVKDDGQIDISIERNEEQYEMFIKDNGSGIPAPKIKRIFNPFFSTKQEGTGLGLWITHEIITSHKGYIEVESESGEGTSFLIYFPKHEKD